ncbi:hypothetical protein Aduo_016196 [Ancylostoma duodenale]
MYGGYGKAQMDKPIQSWTVSYSTLLRRLIQDHRWLRAKIRLNNRIFQRDTYRGLRTRSPEYSEIKLQKAVEAYHWRKIENLTEDYEELLKGLTSCAKAAMESHRSKDEKLNANAKQLLRRRVEIKRDPTATHLEKFTINKACRVAVEEEDPSENIAEINCSLPPHKSEA